MTENQNIIWLTEANAGFIQHKNFKTVISNLLNFCKEMLTDMGDVKFGDQPKWSTESRFKLDFYDLADPYKVFVVIPKNIKVSFIPVPNTLGEKHVIINGGASMDNNQPEIDIFVDKDKTPSDLLDDSDTLEEILSHELVHIVKYLYKNKQKRASEYLDDNDQVIWDKYFSNKHELDAFITQINTELKNIKRSDKSITLAAALLKSTSYRGISKEVKNRKVIKKLLSKVVHYWKNSLGGKINERIKLS